MCYEFKKNGLIASFLKAHTRAKLAVRRINKGKGTNEKMGKGERRRKEEEQQTTKKKCKKRRRSQNDICLEKRNWMDY